MPRGRPKLIRNTEVVVQRGKFANPPVPPDAVIGKSKLSNPVIPPIPETAAYEAPELEERRKAREAAKLNR